MNTAQVLANLAYANHCNQLVLEFYGWVMEPIGSDPPYIVPVLLARDAPETKQEIREELGELADAMGALLEIQWNNRNATSGIAAEGHMATLTHKMRVVAYILV